MYFFTPNISVVRNFRSLRPCVVKTDLPMISDIQCRYPLLAIFIFFFLYVITKRGTSLLYLLLPRNNIIVDVISSPVVIIHETLVYQFIGARFACVNRRPKQ